MDIQKNVDLSNHSTMRLGGKAKSFTTVTTKEELVDALTWAENEGAQTVIIGEGSNIFWSDDGFDGLVIACSIKGFECTAEDEKSATYSIGSGENWDSVVERTAQKGLSGIECLSLIPGTAGATPVQNVGAYGQEIAQTLTSVEAYDNQEKTFVTIAANECSFGYRTSRFKTTDKGRYFITGITLRLNKTPLQPPFYAVLESFLATHNITDYSPLSLRNAVVAIRSDKMPDWHKIANNGSFFANPIVSPEKYETLKQSYPELVGWEYEGGYKLSAGWLLEKAGLRGIHDPETGMATSEKTALVLINEHAKTTEDLLEFKEKIVDAIKEKFGITLEQEPELIA